MKSKSQLQETNAPAVLLIGAPGTGKTTTALCFPRPWFANCAEKLGNAMKVWPDVDFKFSDVLKDDAGKPIAAPYRWNRLVTVTNEAINSAEVDTVVLDDLTAIANMLQEFIVAQPSLSKDGKKLSLAGVSLMDQSHWKPFQTLMTQLILGVRASGKTLVVPCHSTWDKDENTGKITLTPMIGGALKNYIQGLFSDFWECFVDSGKYKVRTVPTYNCTLIRSLPVADVFEPRPGEIYRTGGSGNITTTTQ